MLPALRELVLDLDEHRVPPGGAEPGHPRLLPQHRAGDRLEGAAPGHRQQLPPRRAEGPKEPLGVRPLHLGEQDERLLPREAQAKADATAWLIAALNSVEPMVMQVVSLDIFNAAKPWAKEARPTAVEFAKSRLKYVSETLGTREWLTARFTIADIMMVTVLRNLDNTDILADFPTLATYKRRGEDRAAFKQALADQALGLGDPVELPERA